MTLHFPQHQGTSATASAVHLTTQRLIDQLQPCDLHRITLERHTMQTSSSIHHFSAIHNHALRCREWLYKHQPNTLFTIGGDNSTAMMPISFLLEKHPDMGVVWLSPNTGLQPTRNNLKLFFNNTVINTLLGKGDRLLTKLLFKPLKPEQLFYIGLKNIPDDEYDWMAKNNVPAFSSSTIHNLPAALTSRGVKNLYLHLDADFFKDNDMDTSRCLDSLKGIFEVKGSSVSVLDDVDAQGLISRNVESAFLRFAVKLYTIYQANTE